MRSDLRIGSIRAGCVGMHVYLYGRTLRIKRIYLKVKHHPYDILCWIRYETYEGVYLKYARDEWQIVEGKEEI